MPEVRIKLCPSDQGRRLSLDEFAGAELEDGALYELARGVVVVSDVPGLLHLFVLKAIQRRLWSYSEANEGAIVVIAGGGECSITLPTLVSQRHPDLALYLTPPPPGERPWRRWTPEIVVEVVSKSSGTRDRIEKREEYLAAGVRESWIVDPGREDATLLRREGDRWSEEATDERIVTSLLPGLEIDLPSVFAAGREAGS